MPGVLSLVGIAGVAERPQSVEKLGGKDPLFLRKREILETRKKVTYCSSVPRNGTKG